MPPLERTESSRKPYGSARPPVAGLYDPANEHDACGVAFVVNMTGAASHDIVARGVAALCNLEHRGASGSEINTGDGAGILIQVPDRFFRSVCDFELPPAGAYATGIGFVAPEVVDKVVAAVDAIAAEENMRVVGWRDVPVRADDLGSMALEVMPSFRQLFLAADGPDGAPLTGIELDRRAYVLRKRVEHEIDLGDVDPTDADYACYFASLSSRVLVYKGMLTTGQLASFFPDLVDDRVESSLALVHSRFSTNTFPSWPLAHPYRYVAHNGEINTVMGNRNWMRAREATLATDLIPGDPRQLFPICTPGASDTATFDEVLELLHLGGYELPHAVLMMIPEAWENHESMPQVKKDFYAYHAAKMEPWDGPASIAFTDGTVIGAVLDRNGLRPSRYWVTDDGIVALASEVGVLDVEPSKVIQKGRLQPGRMFLVDTSQGRIVGDDEVKLGLAEANPYGDWLAEGMVKVEDLPASPGGTLDAEELRTHQQQFGYTHEDLKILLSPMAASSKEALGSMGTDTPVAVLSEKSRLLYDYFTQLFAQVTNPPLDAIREELVTSLRVSLGPETNLLAEGVDSCRQILLQTPMIDNAQLASLAALDGYSGFTSRVVSCLFEANRGEAGLQDALDRIRAEASGAFAAGENVIVLSDRGATADLAPIPTLLAVAAVHHHMVREKERTQVSLVVETGEAREVHHLALLLGFGAKAINPYVALDTIAEQVEAGNFGDVDVATAQQNYLTAAGKGVLKVMSKMGISTVASYTGAQIFEAIGLGNDLVDEYFTGCTSRLGGIELGTLAEETLMRHRLAFPERDGRQHRSLEVGGEYQWRREGEYHLFNPETVFKLQHATRSGRYDIFKEYTSRVNEQAKDLATLRGLFEFSSDRPAVPLEEVEPASSIIARFSTGAMSYGSISAEAHETLAIAMNRLGAKSNTGEGGEHPSRFVPDANGDLRRSAIKQVASGRFGVTSEYLVNADDIQIKMAQGAKPGEGGQLPGHKVHPWIAEVRGSTPAVGLISPPPHHDIYSIEDLAQLIHDLKNANPNARIHVKLVAEVGVGTVAAGVSKAHADVVLISGHDGGTGASPLTSLKHAGAPWELGLAETQQTLLLNDLRDRIVVQVDGQLKTGRDVMIAALLGGEEFGFATAPLVVSGCIMMRVCHLDTCPVGVATQRPELRAKFTGKPEFVENFFEYIAEEVRELLAELGFRTLDEAIGHCEVLDTRDAIDQWKASGLDLSPILHRVPVVEGASLHQITEQDHGLDQALDQTLIALCEGALESGDPVSLEIPVRNVNRTVGTLLGHEVTTRYGSAGLPDGTIDITLTGSAGQSFGAFLPRGITMRLLGDANDYFGKGLSGGRLVLAPSPDAVFVAEENIIAGNVILYGATGGEAYLRGVVGERFAVRNSGATAVVEGVGDHGCEYMTGGRVVVLGPTGRNFAAGMSGGLAFVYDPANTFPSLVNPEMVDLEDVVGEDADWLHEVVTRHGELTGSAVAQRLLDDWTTSVGAFAKVYPRDYKRVIEARAKAEAEGLDVNQAIMASAKA